MDKIFKPWTTLTPQPPNFEVAFFSPRGLDGWTKETNPWNVTHTLFNIDIWDGTGTGVSCQSFLQGLNILSIYGTWVALHVWTRCIHGDSRHQAIRQGAMWAQMAPPRKLSNKATWAEKNAATPLRDQSISLSRQPESDESDLMK